MILTADRSKQGRCDGAEEVGRKARRGFLAVNDPPRYAVRIIQARNIWTDVNAA